MLLLFSIILKKLNVLLVGFGNLGYRHFQSILADFTEAKFFIVEPEFKNIKNFIEKDYEYRDLSKKLTIRSSVEEFKNVNFKLCILSTPSLPRIDLLIKIIEFNIDLIILEKLLFPSFDYYEKYANRLVSFPNNIYVNCPRTEYSCYGDIKDKLIKSEKININCRNIVDIGSNSIHWIDLAYFLTGRSINIKDIFNIKITQLYESKRKGYSDFIGSINVVNKFFSLNIESLIPNNHNKEEEFLLTFGQNTYKVNETNCELYKNIDNNESISKIKVPYQSELTSNYLRSFEKGNLKLTNFKDSLLIHKKFFCAFEGNFEDKK